ncbi:hypothetical protein AB0L44_14620 [Nonomuraea wenchangensis]|uniref:hypothetical protein n=1 Tax=Nonomuraea wenchangensis TaxID=568860 RepID=UPI00342F4741
MNVDSTICRARQQAAGARRDGQAQKEPPGGRQDEPDDHSLGRDGPQFTTVLEAIRVPRPRYGPATGSSGAGPWRQGVLATRFDKFAVRFEATVLIAAINKWL